jgi:hypothetical protein
MANEPSNKLTIVVDVPDQGPHLEGRYDDGIKSEFNPETGLWEGKDCIRKYNAKKDEFK